ncbi:hypothetical protein GCM10029964_088900 [Kibdelosporangium lantanae]
MPKDAPPNGGAAADEAWKGPRRRVSEMQAKLHRWAAAAPGRRFDDLFNLVHDPATLIVAFDRMAGNHGAQQRRRGDPHRSRSTAVSAGPPRDHLPTYQDLERVHRS